jgi:hypothetical protein
MTFGFADNDLLLHSDGSSCCSASDLYLKRASTFSANIVGLGKRKRYEEKIRFEEVCSAWMPRRATSTYLNSKSRVVVQAARDYDWRAYLRSMWRGEHGLYSPDFFDGILKSEEFDEDGLPIYVRSRSAFEERLGR